MKTYLYIFTFFFFLIQGKIIQQKYSLKSIAKEAMSQSIIGNDPIIVGNSYSAKKYSKIDLKHPFWNNLKKDDVIIIRKNSEVVATLWGQQAEENGVIVYKAAQDNKYDVKKLRYVLNGKEIDKTEAEKFDMKEIKDYIVVKDRNSEERVVFMNRYD